MTNNTNAFLNRPGLWNTNSYLSAGLPFLTGSSLLTSSFGTNNAQQRIEFPMVTRAITVINRSSADIRIYFTPVSGGNVFPGHHYVTLTDTKDSITLNVKCRELYVSLADNAQGDGAFEIVAELTNIPAREMVELTGSGLTV